MARHIKCPMKTISGYYYRGYIPPFGKGRLGGILKSSDCKISPDPSRDRAYLAFPKRGIGRDSSIEVTKGLSEYPHECRKSPMLNSRSGFTLLELMVSFVIIAMMVGILTGALRLGINAVNSGEKRIESLERLGASVRIVTSQIQSLNPLTFVEDGVKRYFFEGDSGSMRFSSNYSIWGGEKGYVLVRYKVEEDDSGKQVLSVSENIIGIGRIRETTLIGPLDSAGFEFFYKDSLEENGEWLDSWGDNLKIPDKVRLKLVRGNDDFSIIIPIRASGSLSGTSFKPDIFAPFM